MEVYPNLFVGDDVAFQKLQGKPGWSFLRCCKEGPGGHRQLLGYSTLGAPKGTHYLWAKKGSVLALNLLDLSDPNFIDEGMVNRGLDFIEKRLNAGDKVLVACNQGLSRGPTMAMMYLRRIGDLPEGYRAAYKIFKTIYHKYDPGAGVQQYAKAHWNQLMKG